MFDCKLVSLIIPCYNGEKFLNATLESVLVQSYPNLEIIVVDDGSNDRSVEIIQSFGQKIILIQQRNTGVSAARNAGICRAKGDYLMFFDADDIMHPDAVKRRVQILESDKKIGIVVGGVVNFSFDPPNKDGSLEGFKFIESHYFERALRGFSPQGCLLRKKVFLKCGFFDPFLKGCEDTDFLIRVCFFYNFGYDPHKSVYYRVQNNSASNQILTMIQDRKKVLKKNSILGAPKWLYWWNSQLSFINLLGFMLWRIKYKEKSDIKALLKVIRVCIMIPTVLPYLLIAYLKSKVKS